MCIVFELFEIKKTNTLVFCFILFYFYLQSNKLNKAVKYR